MIALRRRWNRIVVIATSVLLTAVSIFSVCIYQRQMSNRAQQNAYQILQDSAIEQAKIFEAMLNGQYESLEIIAQALDLEEQPARLTPKLNHLAETTNFIRIMVANQDGIAYTSDQYTIDVSGETSFQTCMKGKYYVDMTSSDMLHHQRTFVIAIPVIQNGTVVAAVMGEYGENGFADTLISGAYGKSSYSFVCDPSGNVMIRSNHASYMNPYENLLSFLAHTPSVSGATLQQMTEHLRSGTAGSIDYTLDGERRYAAYRPLGINGWMIFNVLPNDVIYT